LALATADTSRRYVPRVPERKCANIRNSYPRRDSRGMEVNDKKRPGRPAVRREGVDSCAGRPPLCIGGQFGFASPRSSTSSSRSPCTAEVGTPRFLDHEPKENPVSRSRLAQEKKELNGRCPRCLYLRGVMSVLNGRSGGMVTGSSPLYPCLAKTRWRYFGLGWGRWKMYLPSLSV